MPMLDNFLFILFAVTNLTLTIFTLLYKNLFLFKKNSINKCLIIFLKNYVKAFMNYVKKQKKYCKTNF